MEWWWRPAVGQGWLAMGVRGKGKVLWGSVAISQLVARPVEGRGVMRWTRLLLLRGWWLLLLGLLLAGLAAAEVV